MFPNIRISGQLSANHSENMSSDQSGEKYQYFYGKAGVSFGASQLLVFSEIIAGDLIRASQLYVRFVSFVIV